MIDFLCSLPLLKTTLAKIVRAMAIEEIVEEECWEQEEEGSDDDQVSTSWCFYYQVLSIIKSI